MSISEAYTCGNLGTRGNNVGVIPSSGMFVSCERNVAVSLDAWLHGGLPPEPSDVHDDSRTCFMPLLRPFQKKCSGTRTNCASGSHGPLQLLHPALASPPFPSQCADAGTIFRFSDATTACSPDFPHPWVPVPRYLPKRRAGARNAVTFCSAVDRQNPFRRSALSFDFWRPSRASPKCNWAMAVPSASLQLGRLGALRRVCCRFGRRKSVCVKTLLHLLVVWMSASVFVIEDDSS
jgi:hypothetical protein